MRPPARAWWVLLILGLAALAAGCAQEPAEGDGGSSSPERPEAAEPEQAPGPPQAREAGTERDVVRWAVDDVEHLVPGDATTRDELLVVSALFTPLTRVEAEGRARPGLALSWSADEDATRWRFELDPDARFHVPEEDGGPRAVTAEDVAFAWDRAAREGRAGFLLEDVRGYEAVAEGRRDALEGVQAVDERTLEVVLDRPHGQLDVLVSHPSLAPVPRERWQEDPDREQDRPVGNGPFVMAEPDAPEREIRVRAVDEPGRLQHSAVDEIFFHRLPPDDAYVAFQQERVHVAPVPSGALRSARARHGDLDRGDPGGVDLGRSPALTALGVRADGALDDPELRQAVSAAIDRQALVEALPDQGSVAADALLLPQLRAAEEGRCDHCSYAPFAARATLGSADVETLTLVIDDAPAHEPLVERLVADLAAVGVTLEVERRPYEAYWDAVRAGQGDLFRIGWRPEHLTGLDVLWPLLHSEGRWNHTGLQDDELDELLEDARGATNPLLRQRWLGDAEERAHEHAVVLPLLGEARPLVQSPEVEGLRPHPLGRFDLRTLALSPTVDADP